ncbi:YfhO family protein [Mesorhizobium sp. M00.F.Ca.ET.216.01.1.1]|uniref:YfhO family protein n=1 Tax=Mesorhizobium sp. M00.F.Ca.ET.216.01.1.1 TaxID=2500528 RepID=UPI0032AEB5BF
MSMRQRSPENQLQKLEAARIGTMPPCMHTKPGFATYLPFLSAALFFTLFYILFFSPALLEGRVLAPGDGYVFYYPAVSIPWRLWEANILAGYPVFADPQFFLWYPPRWFFRDYNAFIIFAYVVASSFTFGYVHWKSGSVIAAFTAGIVYGTGSFMVGHLGHTSIIHAGAWLPLIVWSIDALAERRTAARFVTGAFAVALCLLSGHPQIFVYAMLLAGGLALRNLWVTYTNDSTTAITLAATYAGMVVLGVAACAVQLLPFVEFSELSARSDAWRYGDFVSYSLPLRQIATLFFPYLYGGGINGSTAYFGALNQTELATYAGLGTLFLAACGILARKRNDDALFWLAAAIASILLATVGENHLGHLFYQIPIINSFRASARSAMVFTFAVSVLAGMATAHLQRGELKTRDIALAGGITLGLAIGAGLLTLSSALWAQALRDSGVGSWTIIDAAIFPPFAVLVAMICLLLFWNKLGGRYFRAILLIAAVAVDVGLFGWYYEWRLSPVQKPLSTDWSALQNDLANSKGRLLAMLDPTVSDALRPNMSLLYGFRSVSGYGPMEPKAYQEATGIDTKGFIQELPSPILQRVLGITHIVFSRDMSGSLEFGSCSTEAADKVLEFDLPVPVEATGIRVISNMSCSVTRPDGDPVLTFDATPEKKSDEAALLAGRDTSEWAYDRSDVRDAIQHARAPIESSFDAGGFSGHVYKADLPLATSGPIQVRRLALHFLGNHGGALSVKKLELTNAENGAVYPLNPDVLKLGNSATVRKINENLSVAKLRTKPGGLAWLVREVRSAPTDIAAQIVRTGMFPNGQPFDPDTVALVGGIAPKLDSVPAPVGQTGKVTPLSEDGARLSLRVDASSRSFLFLSRSYHPGWVAYVNGEKVPLYRANAAFQGVVVPAGTSEVTLILDPLSLKLGGLISLIALLILGGCFFVRGKQLGWG